LGHVWSFLLIVIFGIFLSSGLIISDSYAISEVTLNPPEYAVQWESLEIILDDPLLVGTVKVESVRSDGWIRDKITLLQLNHDLDDPPEIFHGKIMLSNPNEVNPPEILGNVMVQPGDTVRVSHDLVIWEEVEVVGQGAHYPNGTRHEVTMKLYGQPGCTDSDEDAICDEWENVSEIRIDDGSGNVYNYTCNDPYPCDNSTKDIFFEIDWMEGHHPDPRAIDKVIDIFNERDIRLHIQIDSEAAIKHNNQIGFPGYQIENMSQYNGFDQLKGNQFGTVEERNYFGTNPTQPNQGALKDAIRDLKQQVFHYGVFVHERQWNVGESGTGEINGNDFMISLASFSGFVGSTDQQAGTLMHEIGHNLGLLHGGIDEVNYKPNYFSVMNYARQMPDFDPNRFLDFSAKALGNNTPEELNEDDLIEKPIGLEFYEDENNPNIDHSQERIIYFCNGGAQAGLYYKTGEKVNWNCNMIFDNGTVSGNINNFDNTSPLADDNLMGHNDWEHLNYFFVNSSDYEDGIHHNDGKGIAGADPSQNKGNPNGVPPGLEGKDLRGPPDNKFDFVTQTNELTINDVIGHRISALLSISDELAKVNEPGFVETRSMENNSPQHASFEQNLDSSKITFTQYSGQNEDIEKNVIANNQVRSQLESVLNEKIPDISTIPLLHLGIEKAVERANHHDLRKTKDILKAVDLGLKFELSEEKYQIISHNVQNQIASIDNALDINLDIEQNKYHLEGHVPSSEPILKEEKVSKMIQDVYDVNGLECPDGTTGNYPTCGPITEPGHPWWIIAVMVITIGIVLVVAFYVNRP
jgi:hypothetical protein